MNKQTNPGPATLPLVASLLRRWTAPTPVEPAAEEWGVEVPYVSFVHTADGTDEPHWPLAA
ncbi:hypothetical protein [Inhella gelatinilytica]|uniref:Uncharacterized protein n=1 Tax=Inhella gelatinilytica TaxID=2795030 RepID=A0A931IYG8_9BURK|nr:hypothetical protein [Inhella gelatinilytica]MBH9552151.1 hypothetical protein [Inhella gelatinilytica]